MKARPLRIEGAWEFTPGRPPEDERGRFANPYLADALTEVAGYPMPVAQTNHSVSRRGVVRGVHFADVPPGQAKYVYCPYGAALDVVVDLRIGSPTFGEHDVVRIDGDSLTAVYVADGIGHALIVLADDTVVHYLCATPYDPRRERGVSPLDPALGLPLPAGIEPILSERDRSAPSLADAAAAGVLPDNDQCRRHYEALRAGRVADST